MAAAAVGEMRVEAAPEVVTAVEAADAVAAVAGTAAAAVAPGR